ncbi:MAG TPA: helix-turn-helix transcriptional regulator [Treponemataceae bacterium]|nr:helix-turn-helix transcriptional regulator [Treponemataceae bacterium]HQL33163.1 helix-turn-helix transcriptional regulator [Treponemataceae bacterium]
MASIRKGKGLTQADLANSIGVSRLLVSDYERGKVRLYADILAKISTALGVSSDDLLGSKKITHEEYIPSLKISKRIKALEKLPEIKQKAILKTLDDLIRANQQD